MEVKALACQLPKDLGVPLSHLTYNEIAQIAVQRGITATLSGATVWRWLSDDAIRPWSYRSWIWPRDPQFTEKAGKVLDLYHSVWDGKPLSSDDYVISTDEKTSIQARRRLVSTLPPRPGQRGRVEHEYERCGALSYIAAWDVHRAKLFGCCEPTTGIAPFQRLINMVMTKEPYRTAKRVFWVSDNGSSHRGQVAANRLRSWYPNAILVHTPIHASWLNQIEIYFSILQRKLLTPNDFTNLEELNRQILAFQVYYETIAKPFEWKFTRSDLHRILAKLSEKDQNAAKMKSASLNAIAPYISPWSKAVAAPLLNCAIAST